MPNSFSQTAQYICPQTNQTFESEIWLIIDRDERPDLIEQAKNGALYAVTSPYTGAILVQGNAPLLIFQPSHSPVLLFSPAQQSTQEQYQQQAAELVQQLQQNLGDKWQNIWLVGGLSGIERDELPFALSDDAEVEQNQGQTASYDDEELRRILQQLVHSPRDRRDMPRRIEMYRRALELMPQQSSEQLWAELQNELASSLAQNPQGSRVQNLEQAIRHYNQALAVYTGKAFPAYSAAIQNNLGNAYRYRIAGSRRENLELAIHYYNQALAVYTREALPADWAMTHTNLADAYRNRIAGSRSENLELAIQHYNRALEVRTREALPAEWAATQNNLAIAYKDRIAGSRSENLELAIHHHNQVLEVRTREALPVEWAATQHNLAHAYSDRIAGSRSENLELAIHHYSQALAVYTREDFPANWAMTQNNLANAYSNRIAGSRRDNLEQAIQHYNQALEVRTREALPADWAATQNNLAAAYSVRIAGSRTENFELAIHHYNQALAVHTREALPVEWAGTQNNLATAYSVRIAGSRSQNLELAIQHYNQALEVRTRDAFPIEHYVTLRNLVLLHFNEKRWSETYQTCLDAITVGKYIFAVAVGDVGRMDAIKQTSDLYTRAAYSAVQLSHYGEALTQLEAGKARLLAEAHSLGDVNLIQLDDDEHGRLSVLRDTIKSLEYEARLTTGHRGRREDLTISAELRDARATLHGLIDEFRAKYPDFMPKDLPLADLLALIPANGALVAPLVTPRGSAIFIVPHGVHEVTAAHVLMLNDFNAEDLNALTREKDASPGWLRYYIDYRFNGAGTKSLFDGIDDVTRRLWDAFMAQVHDKLQTFSVKNILFMPQGDTNLVPLHATWREVDGARRYLLDDYGITYTPSMATLATAKRKTRQGEGALIGGVSKYEKMDDLPNTKAEAEGIAALFATKALMDGDVSVEAVREGVKGKAYLHLSCHGGFGWGGSAFASALVLGNDEPLTLPQIMAQLDLESARLVVLSACETGIVDFDNIPDEFLGLPAGFIQAGASAVISSLWTVEDRSTALLMERMYMNMLELRMEPAQALREAQLWLREATADEIGDYYQQYLIPRMSQSDAIYAFIAIMMQATPNDKPYSDPFYWAAFTYTGL